MRGSVGRVALVAVASAAAVAVAAGPAWAPKYILSAGSFGTCSYAGAESRFQGAFTIQSFAAVDGALVATASVVGTCNGDGSVAAVVPYDVYVFPVAMSADCSPTSAAIEFRPGSATVGAVLGADEKTGEPVKIALDLSATVVDRTWSPADPKSLRAKLCALAHLSEHRSPADLAPTLNTLTMV